MTTMEKINTVNDTLIGIIGSMVIANLPTIQSFATFLLTATFLYYKIRRAKEEYETAKKRNSRKRK